MSAAAQRAVEVRAVLSDGQAVQTLVQQHGTMVKFHFITPITRVPRGLRRSGRAPVN